MSERSDRVAHVVKILDMVAEQANVPATQVMADLAFAQAEATLVLAEQQRIANLISLGVIGGGPLSPYPGEMPRDYLIQNYPDVAAALGLPIEENTGLNN